MKLYYVPKSELDKITDQAVMLDALRLNVLYMVQQAGSGHLGGSLSSLTIMVPLFFGGMGPEDVFITSKGHDAPALYAILQAKGIIPFDTIHTLRRPGGLPGHPTIDVPGVLFNTGSLGMGISKANGLAAADRLAGRTRKIHVLVGDGELQEGQNWEAIRRGLE
jgi:transketolase